MCFAIILSGGKTGLMNNPMSMTDPSGLNGAGECNRAASPGDSTYPDNENCSDTGALPTADRHGEPHKPPPISIPAYPLMAFGQIPVANVDKHGEPKKQTPKAAPSKPAPHNLICSRPIMQSQYTNIFGQMGRDLNVNAAYIMTTAVQESGWSLGHVYGTNSSSNGQPLNNLFGAAPGGGNNKAYPSVLASAQAWESNWGPQLTNNPQSIQAYVADLLSQPHHMYNSNPGYSATIAKLFPSIQNAITTCKVTF